MGHNILTTDGQAVTEDSHVLYCVVEYLRYTGRIKFENVSTLLKRGVKTFFCDYEIAEKRAQELRGKEIESRRYYNFLTRF